MDTEITLTDEFKAKIKAFKEDWFQYYNRISREQTPEYDGNGKQVLKTRPDGKDYIEEAYMRSALDRNFPGWSETMAAPLHFLSSEWVVAQVDLGIIDEHLIQFGINPPIRHFYGVDAVRIQYKKNAPHAPENIIDVGDNCQQAVTGAFKRCINRLTHIGDDVYGKRVEFEGAGSAEDIALESGDFSSFGRWVESQKIPWPRVFQYLGVKNATEIKDFKKAIEVIKGKRQGGDAAGNINDRTITERQ